MSKAKIWCVFEKQLQDGRTVHFQIENVADEMFSTVVEFMLGNYIREDVWWVTAGTANDEAAIEEYRVLLTSVVKQRMSLACFLTDGDGTGRTLVAVNLCLPQKKGIFVQHTPPKTKAGLLSLKMFAEAMKETSIYEKFGVKEYLMGAGLAVTEEYRRLGIATEMLKSRLKLAKDLGFHATGGIFTGDEAQKCADKAGFECYYRIPYRSFGDQCGVTFNTPTEYLKMYAARVD